jgi:hypothetical protein
MLKSLQRVQTGADEIGLTRAEVEYYQAMKDFPGGEYAPGELACVAAAGIGGGFTNTKEIVHVMKYNEAMAGNEKKEWKVVVKEEHAGKRMLKHEVLTY